MSRLLVKSVLPAQDPSPVIATTPAVGAIEKLANDDRSTSVNALTAKTVSSRHA